MVCKHILSFLPSATQIIFQLDSWNKIVGISHTCEIPKNHLKKPRIIKPVVNMSKYSSKQIDEKIRELANSGRELYYIDKNAIEKSNADLIVVQGLCEVCSPIERQAKKAIELLNNEPKILISSPKNLKDIFLDIKRIGIMIGKEKQAYALIDSCKNRIKRLSLLLDNNNATSKPGVLCIEWIDPFYTAGHWIPDMVELAGGKNLVSLSGEKSRHLLLSEIKKIDPEIIIFMPCGFDLVKTENELKKLTNSHLESLKAYKNKKIFAVNAKSYFSIPGPNVIIGIEILGKILHPSIFCDIAVPKRSFKQVVYNKL